MDFDCDNRITIKSINHELIKKISEDFWKIKIKNEMNLFNVIEHIKQRDVIIEDAIYLVKNKSGKYDYIFDIYFKTIKPFTNEEAKSIIEWFKNTYGDVKIILQYDNIFDKKYGEFMYDGTLKHKALPEEFYTEEVLLANRDESQMRSALEKISYTEI